MKIEDELKGRFRNEYHKAIINLFFTSRQLGHRFASLLKAHKLTEPQYNILRVLRGFGDKPRSLNFIRERMLDRSSDVSRLVDRLYQRGLLRRTECPNDRRQKDLEITEEGRKILEQMDSAEQEVDKILAGLSKTEIDQLNDLLDKARLSCMTRASACNEERDTH